MSDPETLLTADDVAALLGGGISASWVYAEARAGRIPHLQLGPRYKRFRRDSIAAWIDELERGGTSLPINDAAPMNGRRP